MRKETDIVSAKEVKSPEQQRAAQTEKLPKFHFFLTFTFSSFKTLFQHLNDVTYNHFHWAKKTTTNSRTLRKVMKLCKVTDHESKLQGSQDCSSMHLGGGSWSFKALYN